MLLYSAFKFTVTAIDSTYSFIPRTLNYKLGGPSPREAPAPPMEPPPQPKQPTIEYDGPPIKGILKKPMPMKYI